MFIDQKYCPSQEAISYQGKSLFLRELTLAFQTLMDRSQPDAKFVASLGLEKMVMRHTGLLTHFEIDLESDEVDISAYVPILDANSPLFGEAALAIRGAKDVISESHENLLTYCRTLRGCVHREQGRVSGIFSKIICPVIIARGSWVHLAVSAEEMAAMVLHELGHLFSAYETLTQTATTNMVLASAAQFLDETADPTLRLQLVHQTAMEINVTIDDPAAVAAKETKGEVFADIILKAMADRELASDAGSLQYDLTSAEFVADQFCVRYGGGRALATGLDKYQRRFNPAYRRGLAMHHTTQAVRTGLSLLTVAVPYLKILTTVAAVYMLSNGHVMNDSYDQPDARLGRIKNDLVQVLKDTKIDRKVRHQILLDIEVIDSLREGVKDRLGYFTYLWIACTSSRRKQFSQMRLQQELESLVNNNLFVTSSKLSHMAGVRTK